MCPCRRWRRLSLDVTPSPSMSRTESAASCVLPVRTRFTSTALAAADKDAAHHRPAYSACFSGTSMTSLGSCLEPQCQKCENGDYQDKYTKESKCLRQQYCDPSKSARAKPCWVCFRVLTFGLSSSPLQTGTSRFPSTTP